VTRSRSIAQGQPPPVCSRSRTEPERPTGPLELDARGCRLRTGTLKGQAPLGRPSLVTPPVTGLSLRASLPEKQPASSARLHAGFTTTPLQSDAPPAGSHGRLGQRPPNPLPGGRVPLWAPTRKSARAGRDATATRGIDGVRRKRRRAPTVALVLSYSSRSQRGFASPH
jgi:hypothetical protein